MRQLAIGECPSGTLPIDMQWRWWQVNWSRKFIEYCCGEPVWWGTLDCLSEDPEELGPPDNPEPLGLSLYHDDGEEQEAEVYFEKCSELYKIFCNAIEWEELNPATIQLAYEHLDYLQNFTRADKTLSKPAIVMNRGEIAEYEATKDDKCDLELFRFPVLISEAMQWQMFVNEWIDSYVKLVCGAPPARSEIKILWIDSTKYRAVRTGLPTKNLGGWGLCWRGKRNNEMLEFAEKVRIASYRFLLAVDWAALDGNVLQSKYLGEAE